MDLLSKILIIKLYLWNDPCIQMVFLQYKTNRLKHSLKTKIKPVVGNHIEKEGRLCDYLEHTDLTFKIWLTSYRGNHNTNIQYIS